MKHPVKTLVILFCTFVGVHVHANQCGREAGSEDVELRWSSVTLGSGLGASGFHAFDSNNNGLNEVVFGTGGGFGGNTSFVVMEYDAGMSTFKLVCQSARFEQPISFIRSFSSDVVSSGSVIVTEGFIDPAEIIIFDHGSGVVVSAIESGLEEINDVAIGDIDSDGNTEIAVLTSDKLAIYDVSNIALEQVIDGGGESLALGRFSSLNSTQVAINTGDVFEINADGVSVVWSYAPLQFSDFLLESGDIDNDGFDELVAADQWYNIRVFDGVTKGVLWEHFPDLDIDALAVSDVNGDAVPEVLYGDGQWGELYVLDGADGTEIFSIPNTEHGVTSIYVGNLDSDVGAELVWGAGYSSTGPDYLYVQDTLTNVLQWRSPAGSDHGVSAVAFGHLNTDEIPDRVFATLESQDGDGIITAVDGSSGSLLWQTEPSTFGLFSGASIHDLLIADVDADGQSEVFVATERFSDGRVVKLNGRTGEVITEIDLGQGSPVYSLVHANIDSDADMELLAGGGLHSSNANGVFVYVVDPIAMEWQGTFPSLGSVRDDLWVLDVADLDEDGTAEVLAVFEEILVVIDPDNNGLRASAGEFGSIAVVEHQNGGSVVYVGNLSGGISILYSDLTLAPVAQVCDSKVEALDVINRDTLVFVCEGALGIFDLSRLAVNWVTDSGFDGNLGQHDRIRIESHPGKTRLLVNGHQAHMFEVNTFDEVSDSDNSDDNMSANMDSGECVDTDGDGWGWDGEASCLTGGTDDVPDTESEAGECVDTDGDGWGWDGESTCLTGGNEDGPVPESASGECIDTDGDGWGWDGVASCVAGDRADGSGSATEPGECTDSDGDGWGWNGEASCLIGGNNEMSDSEVEPRECLDTDGDGWGWDGMQSCRVDL